jgi:hypothetical protein
LHERKLEEEREQMRSRDSKKHFREYRASVVFSYLGKGAPVPMDDYKGRILYDSNPAKLKTTY